MIRQLLTRHLLTATKSSLPASRALSTSATRMAEGDTGAPRAGGVAQGDAFQKREQDNENYYMRKKEMEKLQALKEKIAEHQKHLDELDKHVDDQLSQSSKEGADK